MIYLIMFEGNQNTQNMTYLINRFPKRKRVYNNIYITTKNRNKLFLKIFVFVLYVFLKLFKITSE